MFDLVRITIIVFTTDAGKGYLAGIRRGMIF
jgi:hypothetical protein